MATSNGIEGNPKLVYFGEIMKEDYGMEMNVEKGSVMRI
jgi:hypothetical protein